MDPFNETALDDLLIRSQNLEMRTPISIRQSIDTIIKDSKAALANVDESDEAKTRGQVLLAQEKADASRTREILKEIKLENVVPKTIKTFKELTEQTMQNNIVSSITEIHDKTISLSEDYIFKSIADIWDSKDSSYYLTYSQARDPVTGFYIPIRTQRSTEYSNYIVKNIRPSEFAEKIVESAFIQGDSLYQNHFNIPLIDTFDLIATMRKNSLHPTQGVIQFLQAQKKRAIDQEVNRYPEHAVRGGRFGFLDTVIAYIRMHHSQLGDAGIYWAAIYYLLRCGEIDLAREFTADNEAHFPAEVINYMKGMVITSELRRYFSVELVNNDANPFKIISLAAMLRANSGHADIVNEMKKIDEHALTSDAIVSAEDWIWMRLHIKGASINDLKKELNSLKAETAVIQNPFLTGQTLIMSGEYERAAKWFLAQEDNVDENMHIAIALHMSDFVNASVISQNIIQYAKRIGDINQCVGYFYVLQDVEERAKSLAIFIVEDERGIKVLTGENGQQPPISAWLNPSDIERVMKYAGEEAELRNMHIRAAKIFKLLGDWDRVIANENTELRQCIEGLVDDDDKSIEGAEQLLIELIEKGEPFSVSQFEAFRMLTHLARAADEVRHGNYAEASAAADASGMFPTTLAQVEIAAETIRNQPAVVRRVFPTALELAVKAYAENYKMRASSGKDIYYGRVDKNNTDFESMNMLKRKANAILELAGHFSSLFSQETMRRILDCITIFH